VLQQPAKPKHQQVETKDNTGTAGAADAAAPRGVAAVKNADAKSISSAAAAAVVAAFADSNAVPSKTSKPVVVAASDAPTAAAVAKAAADASAGRRHQQQQQQQQASRAANLQHRALDSKDFSHVEHLLALQQQRDDAAARALSRDAAAAMTAMPSRAAMMKSAAATAATAAVATTADFSRMLLDGKSVLDTMTFVAAHCGAMNYYLASARKQVDDAACDALSRVLASERDAVDVRKRRLKRIKALHKQLQRYIGVDTAYLSGVIRSIQALQIRIGTLVLASSAPHQQQTFWLLRSEANTLLTTPLAMRLLKGAPLAASKPALRDLVRVHPQLVHALETSIRQRVQRFRQNYHDDKQQQSLVAVATSSRSHANTRSAHFERFMQKSCEAKALSSRIIKTVEQFNGTRRGGGSSSSRVAASAKTKRHHNDHHHHHQHRHHARRQKRPEGSRRASSQKQQQQLSKEERHVLKKVLHLLRHDEKKKVAAASSQQKKKSKKTLSRHHAAHHVSSKRRRDRHRRHCDTAASCKHCCATESTTTCGVY
jgi:hypothetical protein